MKLTLMTGATIASLLISSAATAQQSNEYDPAGTVGSSSTRALGTNVLNSDFDVEGPTGDLRCLGVEEVNLSTAATPGTHYIVSGAGTATVGSGMLHLFDSTGTFISSVSQVTNSTVWQGRDMEAVSDGQGGYTLWVGSDNAELSEYSVDSAGVITHVALHTVNGLTGTTRALCTSDGGTTFHTKSFTSPFYTFDYVGGAFNVQSSNPATAPSAYGFGYDAGCNAIWSSDTDGNLTEIDLAGNATGRQALYASTVPWGGAGISAQGGVDVYADSRNTGSQLTAVVLVQNTFDHIYLQELEDCGPAGPSVSIGGSCSGGAISVDVSNATPGGPLALYYAVAPGSFTVPAASPACGGLNLPVSAPVRIPGLFTADASGSFSFPRNTQPNWCGVIMVGAVDVATCTATNVATL